MSMASDTAAREASLARRIARSLRAELRGRFLGLPHEVVMGLIERRRLMIARLMEFESIRGSVRPELSEELLSELVELHRAVRCARVEAEARAARLRESIARLVNGPAGVGSSGAGAASVDSDIGSV